MTSTTPNSRINIKNAELTTRIEKDYTEIYSLTQYRNFLRATKSKLILIVFIPNPSKMTVLKQVGLYNNIIDGVKTIAAKLKNDFIPFHVCVIYCLNDKYNNKQDGRDLIMQIERVRYLPTFRVMFNSEVLYETIGWDWNVLFGNIRMLTNVDNDMRRKWIIDTSGNAQKVSYSFLQDKVSDLEINMDDLQLPTDWSRNSPDYLGSGSFGSVVKAVYLSKQVAVKLLKASDDNVLGLQQLQECCKEVHPNLVPLIGIGILNNVQQANTWCLLQPLYGRGDLYSLMEKTTPTDTIISRIPSHLNYLNNTLRVLLDVSCGLAHLHSKNKMHCDLKPANILLDNGYNASISDFGLIHTISQIIGYDNARCTVYYAAPEICENMKKTTYGTDPNVNLTEVKTSSDVYSFGIIALHLLTEIYDPLLLYEFVDSVHKKDYKKQVGILNGKGYSNITVLNDFIADGRLFARKDQFTDLVCSAELIHNLKLCLDFDESNRPPMKKMASILAQEFKAFESRLTLNKTEQNVIDDSDLEENHVEPNFNSGASSSSDDINIEQKTPSHDIKVEQKTPSPKTPSPKGNRKPRINNFTDTSKNEIRTPSTKF